MGNFERARRRTAGFTLIELLSVVAIIGVLSSIAIPKLSGIIEKARVAKAIGDLRTISIDLYSLDSLPATLAGINRDLMLDPWGRPYQYLRFGARRGNAPPAGARKDRFLVPINSQFDIYSMGKDGASVAPLTAKASRDDVVMANDGGFFGLARNF